MSKRIIISIFLILLSTSLYSEDYLERDLFGLGFSYTLPQETFPGLFGLNVLYTPADFITGFTAIAQSDFSTATKIGLGIERYIVLIPSSFINNRFFHISAGALGTYTFKQDLDHNNFWYDVYLTTNIAPMPPMWGLGITLSYNHIDMFALRLEYSGAIFLEKIE